MNGSEHLKVLLFQFVKIADYLTNFCVCYFLVTFKSQLQLTTYHHTIGAMCCVLLGIKVKYYDFGPER